MIKIELLDTDLDDYFTSGDTDINTEEIITENRNLTQDLTNKIFDLALAQNDAQIKILLENNNWVVNTLNSDGVAIAHMFSLIDYAQGYDILKCVGGNLNIKDKNGQTPLHYSVLSNKINCIHSLCDNNANINEQDNSGNTPLHIAVINNLNECVDTLIKKSANPFIRNNNNHTPYEYSFLNRTIYLKITDYILELATKK